jgi:hypothetical protein
MTTSSLAATRRYPGRLYLALGLVVPFLGVIAFFVQVFSMERLTMPWYMPIAAVLGVLLVLASLSLARSVWRVLALVLVVLIAGAEGWFLLEMRLPKYEGPVAEGQPFPEFKTLRADGTDFTQANLEGDKHNVLVTFRGRW